MVIVSRYGITFPHSQLYSICLQSAIKYEITARWSQSISFIVLHVVPRGSGGAAIVCNKPKPNAPCCLLEMTKKKHDFSQITNKAVEAVICHNLPKLTCYRTHLECAAHGEYYPAYVRWVYTLQLTMLSTKNVKVEWTEVCNVDLLNK